MEPLIDIAAKLDKFGNFKLADKIDKAIRVAQEATPGLVTQLGPRRFSPRVPGIFGNPLTSEGLREGTQGFQYNDPNDSYYDPIKGALFQGSGPENAFVNQNFIGGKEYQELMKTPEGQKKILDSLSNQYYTQQKTQFAPYAAEARINQEISFFLKNMEKYKNNPTEGYRILSPSLIPALREALVGQDESQWDSTIEKFRSKLPSNLYLQINDTINQAKREAIIRKGAQTKSLKENVQTVMQNPETATPPTVAPAAATPATVAQQPYVETPEIKAAESQVYQNLIGMFKSYLATNDVNSLIAVRSQAKSQFKNPDRYRAFKEQTDNLAQSKGINISTMN